jgi:hypothetical protein
VYEQYDWAWGTTREDKRLGRALRRQPNGDCVYIDGSGCAIHGNAQRVLSLHTMMSKQVLFAFTLGLFTGVMLVTLTEMVLK